MTLRFPLPVGCGRVFLLGHRAQRARLPDRHAEGVSPVTLDLGHLYLKVRRRRKLVGARHRTWRAGRPVRLCDSPNCTLRDNGQISLP